MISEFKLIEKIKKIIPRNLQCELGIGDDAAVLKTPPGEKLIVATDALVEGIDFFYKKKHFQKWGWVNAAQAGRKALAVNLSDLAAMGAKPLACVVSLGIPSSMKVSWILDFYRGLVHLAKPYGIHCAGGDLSRAKYFFASVTVMGSAKASEIVTRSHARSGDWIALTGALGGSLIEKHHAFKPRVEEARFLARFFKPTAMIDISDGLLQDLCHLLENSHVGAALELSEIPISQSAILLAANHPQKALERACTDGEDFELLFTLSASRKMKLEKAWKKHFSNVLLSWIGRITPRKGKIDWMFQGKKVLVPTFKRAGYQHFV